MRVSRNELTASLKKAFEGLGFSVGDYQDAAAMVVWSEMHGLGGLSQLQRALPFLDNSPCLNAKLISNTEQQVVLDGQNSSVLLCGTQAVRLACAMAGEKGNGRVQLDNCHNRQLISQCLVGAAQLGSALVAYWQQDNLGHKLSIEAGAQQPEYRQYSLANSGCAQSLLIFVSTDLAEIEHQFIAETTLGVEAHSVGPEAMLESYNQALELGIEIVAELWHELDNLVARVLVESTESSRAGAGD
ncbi:MAG: DUF3726 domain-containing protein [Porticoccaceae bacterium]|jgi:LDH2 family malate/lactate/ureidoglycolate dehydrogenase|nr:DUF3726 domain-containing protein [Porticoccaceae bacterium]MBT5577577.1 DUF3726 domain-containing protein [Porticoccaceae bacterium]MBT7375241.1 DUF3726 domain-containing protein [Porticoccaceae bacterium]